MQRQLNSASRPLACKALLTETLPRAEYWEQNVRRVTLPVNVSSNCMPAMYWAID